MISKFDFRKVAIILASLLFLLLPSTISYAKPLSNKGAPASSSAPADPGYRTIRWLDNKGHTIRSWKGSPREAEQIVQKQNAQYQLTQFFNNKGHMQPGINMVACDSGNDFFTIYSTDGTLCLANAGDFINVWLGNNVFEVYAGRNHGYFWGGTSPVQSQESLIYINWWEYVLMPSGTKWYVDEVQILPAN